MSELSCAAQRSEISGKDDAWVLVVARGPQLPAHPSTSSPVLHTPDRAAPLRVDRLLAGPPLDGRSESLSSHVGRLGAIAHPATPSAVIGELAAAGILGRGGAGFPMAEKWRAVAAARGRAVVVANGAEGEPESYKDRVLLQHRPHLVIDGALIAAHAVGADVAVLYVGGEHTAALRAVRRAVTERDADEQRILRIVEAPEGYVAGEASAVVHYVDAGDARPTPTPPRMSERGVRDRPTLVQNVESLACAALVARFGSGWYREAGRGDARGTALVTIGGAVRAPGVVEIELGTPVGEVIERAGGAEGRPQAVLLGGYFGAWSDVRDAWHLALDPVTLRDNGLAFGCGLVHVLPARACGLRRVASIARFLAGSTAEQCGPCRFGLPAIAAALHRLAEGRGRQDDIDDVTRWTAQIRRRGLCRHPDGAIQQIASGLSVFAEDVRAHIAGWSCQAAGAAAMTA
jgi:NADH:ubiquinone oxidoreductase subunit F (NADH-binding)